MSSIPSYSIDENFRRVRMQRNTLFVIVEGEGDIPIYESFFSQKTTNEATFEIFHAGGKRKIQQNYQSIPKDNSILIVDKDFDDQPAGRNIISLTKYSIENYMICNTVICHSLQFALKKRISEVNEEFNLDDFYTHNTPYIIDLLKTFFYYQREIASGADGERPSWSERFICEDRSWKICRKKVDQIKGELLGPSYDQEFIDHFFRENFTLPDQPCNAFPGKILMTSLQRYIMEKANEIKRGAGSKYNNPESTQLLLASTLHRSPQINNDLIQAVEIINNFPKNSSRTSTSSQPIT